jgi:hypothetical protein
VAPAFAGGESALENYIGTTIEYPQEAIDNNVEGKVNVRFAVDEKGIYPTFQRLEINSVMDWKKKQ